MSTQHKTSWEEFVRGIEADNEAAKKQRAMLRRREHESPQVFTGKWALCLAVICFGCCGYLFWLIWNGWR